MLTNSQQPAATRVQDAFLASGDASTALAERTAQVDRIVLAASQALLAAAPEGLSLLAVGGYGRRHLFPYSDVDLLLLCATEKLVTGLKEPISAFLQQLWDAGLRVSQSVRTPTECLEVHDQNAELNISLLDQRYLAGDRALYGLLADGLPRFLRGNRETLVRNLARLTRERHTKSGNTIYHLEPNVKETPGGMRDFQLVGWLDQLRDAGSGYPTGSTPEELNQAFRFLARVRCYLHCQAGRDSNLLTFDAQDAIADEWWPGGVVAEGAKAHAAEGYASHWMRQYYRHARMVYRAATRGLDAAESQTSSLLSQFRDWRSRLSNADFSVHRERAHFRSPQQLDSDPNLVLRLFEFVARHGIRLSLEAEQRIESRIDRLRLAFADTQPWWPAIEAILSLPHAPMALRSMHDTGLLTAVFPELRDIECLVIRDFYHRYTVDEHTLVAIQNLWSLRDPSPSRNGYADLLNEVKQPAVLLFALVFHDSGKASPNEGHVDASVRLVTRAMARIQVPQPEREMALFLIRNHLELSATLQSRDVFDPLTIRELARRVETVERLKALTLLTWADISAVNPGAMTPWRAEQLWQLYMMVYNELTRELESDRIANLSAGPPEKVAFLEGFPVRYLHTHTEAEIDAHVELERRSQKKGAAVEIRRLETAWQLTLVTADRPGLFAAAAGTLSSFGMNILKAEAFSNKLGLILDTFTFSDPNRTLDLNPTEVDRLRTVAERVLAGKANVRELLRNRPKPKLPSRRAAVKSRVSFNPEASNTATLVEIVAQDRPGLLYDLASAISQAGCNIEVVLIDTEAHKAIDVFYVTADRQKLDAARQAVLGEALRRACEGGEPPAAA
jgi:[protein-PII] uridylyltransferase